MSVAAVAGHDSALVGGLAVSVRSEPRFTRDADIVVAVSTDDDSEALVHAFIRNGYQLQAILEQSGVTRLSGARLIDPQGIEIDVLVASSGIEVEIAAAADAVEIEPGRLVKVARTGHLVALKLLSVAVGRETDASDLRALARVADTEEWTLAAQSVVDITSRGFNRGRDLVKGLRQLRENSRVEVPEVGP